MGPLHEEKWNLLCNIVQDERIWIEFRYRTLSDTLPGAHEIIESRGIFQLPNLFQTSNLSSDRNVFTYCVEHFLVPTEGESAAEPLHMLSHLWKLGDQNYRDHLLNAMQSCLYRDGDDRTELLSPMERLTDESSLQEIEQSFLEVKELLRNAGEIDGPSGRMYIIRRTLNEFLDGRNARSLDSDILQIYREVSRLEEINEFTIYTQVNSFFNIDNIERMREIHGDEFIYKLLVDIVIDQYVESISSTVTLFAIIKEYGTGYLILDDRLLENLFIRKLAGRSRFSVIESICEVICDCKDCITDINALLCIYQYLEENRREEFMEILSGFSQRSGRICLLIDYLQESLTYDNFIEELRQDEREHRDA